MNPKTMILPDDAIRLASRRWRETHRDTFAGMFADEPDSALRFLPDFSTGDFSGSGKVADFSRMFEGRDAMVVAPMFDTSKGEDFHDMFSGCSSLREIPALDLRSAKNLSGFVDGCGELEKINIINISASLDVSCCRKLSAKAIKRLFANLANAEGKGLILRIGGGNLAKVKAEDIAVATGKGWTVC